MIDACRLLNMMVHAVPVQITRPNTGIEGDEEFRSLLACSLLLYGAVQGKCQLATTCLQSLSSFTVRTSCMVRKHYLLLLSCD